MKLEVNPWTGYVDIMLLGVCLEYFLHFGSFVDFETSLYYATVVYDGKDDGSASSVAFVNGHVVTIIVCGGGSS